MDKEKYTRQIDAYYKKRLRSYEMIELGETPEVLVQRGVPKLPLVMKQSTLTKCVRKNTGSRSAHDLPRSVIEAVPEQICNPIFLIQDKESHSIALISDMEDKDRNKILIAIRLRELKDGVEVNEIKSIYGKTKLFEYLNRHMEKGQLEVINTKKAESLSRVIGLHLPKALITSNHDYNVPRQEPKVNCKSANYSKSSVGSVVSRLREYQQQIQKQDAEESRQNSIQHRFRDRER